MIGRSRWLRAAVAGWAVVALTACTGGGGSVADPPASSDPPSGTPSSSTATPLGENEVEPPGRLKDRLYRPDMLIFSRKELSDATVKRIKALREVKFAGLISIEYEANEKEPTRDVRACVEVFQEAAKKKA